jgi:hypothetical protein
MHEDFVKIHDVNNPLEKAVYKILQAKSSGKQLRLLAKRRQKAIPRAEEWTATTRRTARGSTRRKRRKKILFQRLRRQGRAGS